MIESVLSVVMLVLGQTPQASLPPEGDRTVAVPGLVEQEVVLSIDAEGVPWVTADTLDGLYQGEGFLHGQHRFFQMDMMRRYAAGEIAALLGSRMLSIDASQRVFQLRRAADRILDELPAAHVRHLETYAHGVNAGVADLGAPPPEYLLLGTPPQPWTPADSILVLLAMGDQLCGGSIRNELARDVVLRNGSRELMDFLFPDVRANDRPMMEDAGAMPPPLPTRDPDAVPGVGRGPFIVDPVVLGSNAWIVSGDRTEHGGAMLANDPHLGITAPNTWYRVGLFAPAGSPAAWPAVDDEPSEGWWVFGLSLPGVPGIAIGTNGHVAWGFTNSEVDTQDLVRIEEHPIDLSRYRVGTAEDGTPIYEPYTWDVELLDVARAEPEQLEIRSTRWGPVWTGDRIMVPHARKWSLTEPGGFDLGILDVPRARSTSEALDVFKGWGGPPQNAMVADRDGNIGWTITGRLPNRTGLDGSVPVYWFDGAGWDGWLDDSHRPRVENPESGVLYSANNRMASLDVARRLGRDWAAPDRAHRIGVLLDRDGTFTEQDLLDIQLDTAVPQLRPLHERLLAIVPENDPDDRIRRAREHLEGWNGTAGAGQTGFRILLMVDRRVADQLLGTMLPKAMEEGVGIDADPLRRVVSAEADEWLPEGYGSWDELHDEAFRAVVAELASRDAGGSGLDMPWGEVNTSEFAHPFSRGTPWGGGNLNLPAHSQPGHPTAVRVAHPRFGASARVVVSPGREQQGILQTPGGQSGHYLSPNYRDLHEAWRTGAPSGLLPGEPVSMVRLQQVAGP